MLPQGIRPTTQKVKQALFNILAGRIKNTKVLELFAGSGNLGIEALNRGAEKVVFVDNDFACIDAIRQNLKRRDFLEAAEIKCLDFEKALSSFAKKEERFDLIFADPPYEQRLGEKILQKVSQCDILFPDGLLIIEHYKKEILPQEVGNLILKKQRKYGDTVLSFYEPCSRNSKHQAPNNKQITSTKIQTI